jgi:hypothetical protein
MTVVLQSLTLAAQVTSVHRGAVLPEGRIVVVVVPLAALAFYFLVVRRNRDR